MVKEFWLNLPVKDVKKSKAFFIHLGFLFNENMGGDAAHSACLLVGEKKIVVMLSDEATFKGYTGGALTDATKGAEILLSIDAQSKEEVDEMAKKAVQAGGSSNHKPTKMQGWMYGCVFSDLDGHRWNVLYMDMSKM